MESPISHQVMGYDRTSAMFSPDGRLLQVEYARKTIKQGSSVIGIRCQDGVVLAADKKMIEKLMVPESIDKIFMIDEHIIAAPAGIIGDGRILIEKAQLLAQQYRFVYDVPIDLKELVKQVCDFMHMHTQYGGIRPFGVSILFAGVNEEPHIFVTDVTGAYFEYKATAIGEYESQIKEILEKEYKEDIKVKDAIKLVVKILKKVLKKDFDVERIEVRYITIDEKKPKKLSKKEILKLAKNSK